MPTETEFRTAASSLRRGAGSVRNVHDDLVPLRNDTGMRAGPYVVIVDTLMDASMLNAGFAAAEMDRVAGVYDVRAQECANYTVALRNHGDDLELWLGGGRVGPRPTEPSGYPWYVEAG